MRGPFTWGARDCCTAACDAWAALWGHDPMGQARGTYDTAFGAARIIRRAGGYAAWCDTALGLRRTDRPLPGDLALVMASDGIFGAAMGLVITGTQTVVKAPSGVTVTPARIIGGWTCRD